MISAENSDDDEYDEQLAQVNSQKYQLKEVWNYQNYTKFINLKIVICNENINI